MENTKPASPTPSKPVMDVQPPKPPVVPSAPSVVDSPATAPAVTPEADEPASPAPVVSEEKVNSVAPTADTGVSNNEDVPAAPAPSPAEDTAPKAADASPMAIPPTPVHHARVPRGTIIVAIVVALLLAGTSVFAYLKTKDSTITSDQNKTQTQDTATPKVTTSDVNQTSQEIDDGLKTIDESKDFGTSDLTDSTLGL
jgi:uncharacterized protein HemX